MKTVAPRIVAREDVQVSPWVRLVAKEVDFGRGGPTEVYHSVAQADYLGILALTPDGRVPLIWQYRPAVEAFTCELPAGLAEPGEPPDEGCRRELLEETGLHAHSVQALGAYFADTARLGNRFHAFLVRAGEPDPSFVPEPGSRVEFVSPATLRQYVSNGTFPLQTHIGVLALAALAGVNLLRDERP